MLDQNNAQTAPVDTRKIAAHTKAPHLDTRAIHGRLRQALATLREAECNAVTLFAEIFHRRLYRELGYADIHIYAGEALGFSRTKTYEFIRLAESLEKLPKLKKGIESGDVPWTKARAIVQIATPESEKRWLEIAQSSSRRELEQQVIRSKALRKAKKRNQGQGELLVEHAATDPAPDRGDLNAVARPAPPEAAPVQSMTLRINPLQWAHFDAMVEKLMKRHNCGRSEVILMALEVFLCSGKRSTQDAVSSQDEETSQDEKSTRVDSITPYQVIIYRCENCSAGAVGPERIPLSEAQKGQVECDSRVLEPGKRNRSSIPPSRRRAVLKRDGHRCRVQGCGSTHFLEVHHMKSRQDGGSNGEQNLVTLCSKCHGHLHESGNVLPPLRKP